MSHTVRAGLVLAALCVLAAPAALADGPDGETVVVSRPGVVFHAAGARDLRGRGRELTIGAAQKAGYLPCSACFAPAATTATLSASAGAGTASGKAGTHGRGVVLPPSSDVTQPFGERYSHRGRGFGSGAIRDPYEDLMTLRLPLSRTGAFSEIH